jgi:hypothetical protein
MADEEKWEFQIDPPREDEPEYQHVAFVDPSDGRAWWADVYLPVFIVKQLVADHAANERQLRYRRER